MTAVRMSRMAVATTPFLGAILVFSSHVPAQRPDAANPADSGTYLTSLSTDKPVYRIGETVHIRGVLLHATERTPLRQASNPATIEIRGPKGDVVASGWAQLENSVAGFGWKVPEGQPGGEYTARVSYPDGHPPAERKFDVRAYRPPRLRSQIVFIRDGYGPGDEVAATLHTERSEGGIPTDAKITAIARVDGAEVFTGPATLDGQGNCTIRFSLPAEIERGEGTLAFVIEDGGAVETAAKTIPILLQTVDLAIYPEGGELVAGLPGRIYIEARTPARKPADIAGVVVDEHDETVATFRTEHEGRGRFSFTPRRGGRYALRVTEPGGIKARFPLPEVRESGAVIRAMQDRVGKDEPVRLKVGFVVQASSLPPLKPGHGQAETPAPQAGSKLTVTLSQRGERLISLPLETKPGLLSEVTLVPPEGASGVLIATVWGEAGKPLAERLVYREPARALRIRLTPDLQNYMPGGRVKLTVETHDYTGRPVGAVVGLTVSDDSVLEMIEKREQAPRLPVMVLLEGDVRELADAHVYLAGQEGDGGPSSGHALSSEASSQSSQRKAPVTSSLAVDLLLGTQGWRRFAFVNTSEFVEQHGDAARRVLALREPRRFFGGVAGEERFRFEALAIRTGAPMPAAAPAVQMDALEVKAGDVDGDGMDLLMRDALGMVQDVRGDVLVVEEEAKAEGRAAAVELPAKAADAAARVAPGQPGQLAGGRLREAAALPGAGGVVAVRVYAHEVRPQRSPGDRLDFTETLYWNAGVRTDDRTGKATITFGLSDAVTAFRVLADAFADDGALGEATATIESLEPFHIEPKLPLEVTTGDVIQLPVGVVSALSQELRQVRLSAEAGPGLDVAGDRPFALRGQGRTRRFLDVQVGSGHISSELVIRAQAGPYSDKVTRQLSIQPLGFPVEIAFGGMIGPDAPASHVLIIPDKMVKGSLASSVAVYPTPLANMTAALERLIREPYGCFEQTSSTVYPLVMAQQYFLSHTGIEPSLIQRTAEMLDKGYARLVSFECTKKGYEWFGSDPGHEALTAYGLLQFTDMAGVRRVDDVMVQRTRQWLLNRRDGKGGFERDAKAIDSFGGAPDDTTNAYITWALLSAGEKGLDTEVSALRRQAADTKDSYILALAANVLAQDGDSDAAGRCMDTLVKSQLSDGSVDGAATSITRSGGDALRIETTALAVLAWLREPAYTAAAENGIRFLAESCKAGRFGSTQSTILALRAIVDYDKSRARPKASGQLQVYVDGQPLGEAVAFDASTQGAIALPDISGQLGPGRYDVEIRMTDGSPMPYALTVNCYDVLPPSSDECPLTLNVMLGHERLAEGEVTEAQIEVVNRGAEAAPTPVAIIGLPGGLEPRHDQLKELVRAGRIDAYEVIGREVVCYWRQLKPGQRAAFPISLVAAVPGTYTGPASRAYLYYTDEHRTWVPGAAVTITPRRE